MVAFRKRRSLASVALAVIAAGLILAGATVPAGAQGSQHCGDIRSNETWAAATSPHILTCTVTVRGATLTIEPNVRLLLAEGVSLVIDSGSSLQAVGAQDGPINITGQQDTAGYWSQILFQPGANESQMIFVSVMSGGHGGVPMVEARAVVLTSNIDFRLAAGVPLAFSANALGPSLDAPGRATVMQQCQLVTFRENGSRFIEILAGADVDVTEPQTWHNFCIPYRCNDNITIAGPDEPSLRLDRGVIIRFNGDAGITAGVDDDNRGGFEADGTLDEPVVLTSETEEPGAWTGVNFTEFSAANSLINARVEYGGRGDGPMVLVRGSDTIAIELQLAHAKTYPLALLPAAVGRFVSALRVTEKPVFVENGIERILVLADDADVDIPFSTAWTDIGADYEIDGTLTVAGANRPAELVIDAGLTRPSPELRLVFDGDSSLVIGDPVHGSGSLQVLGAITKPVVLSGASAQPGSWGGIRITDEAERANIENAVVENGGAGGGPMIAWGDAGGYITNTTLSGAVGYPLSVPLSRAEVVMGEDQKHAANRLRLVGNGADHLLVHVDRPLSKSLTTWANPGAPVEFDAGVLVASPQTPLLQIFDGLMLLFPAGAKLDLGVNVDSRAAVRVVNEDPDFPVVFGALDPVAGWAGVHVHTGSTLTGEGLLLRDAAADAANLAVAGGTVVLQSLTLQGASRGVGLEVTGSMGRAEVTRGRITDYRIGVRAAEGGWLELSRIYLDGNSEWGVLNEDPRLCQVANLFYWGTGAGPRDESDAEDGCVNAAWNSPQGQRVSDDVDWWPYAVDANFTPSSGLGPSPWRVFMPWAVRAYPLPGSSAAASATSRSTAPRR